MKKFITLLLSCALLLGCNKAKPSHVSHEQVVRDYINLTYKPAEAMLYMDMKDGRKPICSATAFQRVDDGYLFLSAGHCISMTDPKGVFYVSPDTQNPEQYYPADVVAYGDLNQDIDFSVLHVKALPGAFGTVELGHDPVQDGEAIISVSNPMGMGKLVLRGEIAMTKWNHHDVNDENGFKDDWYGDVLFEMMGEGPGSSGSTIVCEDQMKVCATISGHDGTAMIGQPIEKFEQWWALVQAGKIDPKPPLPVVKDVDDPFAALRRVIEGIKEKP